MTALVLLVTYVAIFAVAFLIVRFVVERMTAVTDFTSLKTVTFGDESAVTPNRIASVVSVLTIFLIWGAFTGSKTTLFHMPGPFIGDTSFTYTVEDSAGTRDSATVSVRSATGIRGSPGCLFRYFSILPRSRVRPR